MIARRGILVKLHFTRGIWYNAGMEYTLIRCSRKTAALRVTPGGGLEVRAPRLMPKAAIDGFVEANAAWIARQRAKLDEVHRAASDAGALTEADIKELAERMRKVLPQKLARIADSMGVGYERVSVRCQRSKWGSCTAEGNLNFNCLLMLAPEEVLDYVLIHELCHRRHMDHSKEFWADVERLDRDYREHKKWLRENGAVLMRRVRKGERNA